MANMRKITSTVLTALSMIDSARIVSFAGKSISSTEARKILSPEGYEIVFGTTTTNVTSTDTNTTTEQENNMTSTTTETNNSTNTTTAATINTNNEQENNMNTNTTTEVVQANDYDGMDRDELIALFSSRKYRKAELAEMLADHVLEARAVGTRFAELEAQMEKIALDLQEKIDNAMKKPNANTDQEQVDTGPQWTEHQLGVFAFWRDIGWGQHITQGQKAWAAGVSEHVLLAQHGNNSWIVSWDRRFYKTNPRALRAVMKSWASSARAAGHHTHMGPKGLVVHFRR